MPSLLFLAPLSFSSLKGEIKWMDEYKHLKGFQAIWAPGLNYFFSTFSPFPPVSLFSPFSPFSPFSLFFSSLSFYFSSFFLIFLLSPGSLCPLFLFSPTHVPLLTCPFVDLNCELVQLRRLSMQRRHSSKRT